MVKVSVSVLLTSNESVPFSALVERLRDAGLRIQHKLQTSRVVTGEISDERVASLREIEGVMEVEEVQEVRIAPPDFDVQ